MRITKKNIKNKKHFFFYPSNMIIYSEHELKNEHISKNYALFLDDTRLPKDVKWIELPLKNWVIVRNYNEFIACIIKYGIPEVCSMDHDLADEHYKEYTVAHNNRIIGEKRIRYERFAEKTGRDCALWLANYCIDKGIPIPLYYLHSLNGIGCANIHSILESARKVLNERIDGHPIDRGSGER